MGKSVAIIDSVELSNVRYELGHSDRKESLVFNFEGTWRGEKFRLRGLALSRGGHSRDWDTFEIGDFRVQRYEATLYKQDGEKFRYLSYGEGFSDTARSSIYEECERAAQDYLGAVTAEDLEPLKQAGLGAWLSNSVHQNPGWDNERASGLEIAMRTFGIVANGDVVGALATVEIAYKALVDAQATLRDLGAA